MVFFHPKGFLVLVKKSSLFPNLIVMIEMVSAVISDDPFAIEALQEDGERPESAIGVFVDVNVTPPEREK